MGLGIRQHVCRNENGSQPNHGLGSLAKRQQRKAVGARGCRIAQKNLERPGTEERERGSLAALPLLPFL
jgi:hypothetical protein